MSYMLKNSIYSKISIDNSFPMVYTIFVQQATNRHNMLYLAFKFSILPLKYDTQTGLFEQFKQPRLAYCRCFITFLPLHDFPPGVLPLSGDLRANEPPTIHACVFLQAPPLVREYSGTVR